MDDDDEAVQSFENGLFRRILKGDHRISIQMIRFRRVQTVRGEEAGEFIRSRRHVP